MPAGAAATKAEQRKERSTGEALPDYLRLCPQQEECRVRACEWVVIGMVLLGSSAAGQAAAEQPRTLKERLSDKASDQQRVDNCRVPIDRRGSVPRPDCPEGVRPVGVAVPAGASD